MHRTVVTVFDSRLGQSEENHDESIIAFWPMQGDVINAKESALVRAARGILGLCSHFDEVSTLRIHGILISRHLDIVYTIMSC